MIGELELSGVGIKISRFIVGLAGGDLALTLLFVGIVSLIVGMGLDATPAYITLATLMAPALIRLGVSDVAAHLYVIYWGLASFYTPPTCIAVFVTASIAKSKVWETGWEAVRLGIAAFLIPFAFVYNDGLLLQARPFRVVPKIIRLGRTLPDRVGSGCSDGSRPEAPPSRRGYACVGARPLRGHAPCDLAPRCSRSSAPTRGLRGEAARSVHAYPRQRRLLQDEVLGARRRKGPRGR